MGKSKGPESRRDSYSRKSGSQEHNVLQAQANLLIHQKEEERVKIDPELLKFVLTGLLP